MNPRHLTLLSTVLFTTLCSSSFVRAGLITIDFDDLGAGTRTGTHYLNRGVMFFDSNGSRGTSTAIREINGVAVTAQVDNFGTSVSLPNVLVPSAASNNDIWVQFYESAVKRTTARFIQAQNDAEGFPKVALEAYDRNGVLLERTSLVGGSQFLSITNPNIYLAKFVSNPNTPGTSASTMCRSSSPPFPNQPPRC
jgi:hypothetical protein